MELAPEERVNMSLDDLIKAKKSNEKKRPAKKQTPRQKGKLVVTPPSQAPGNTAVKSAAQGKVKRNAAANQRRGLNNTGKASQGEIKKTVKKAVNQNLKRQSAVKTNQLKSPPKLGSGLKISFRPAELSQTTDRNVQAQILGALSKDPSFKNRGNSQGSRRVQVQAVRPPAKKKVVVRK